MPPVPPPFTAFFRPCTIALESAHVDPISTDWQHTQEISWFLMSLLQPSSPVMAMFWWHRCCRSLAWPRGWTQHGLLLLLWLCAYCSPGRAHLFSYWFLRMLFIALFYSWLLRVLTSNMMHLKKGPSLDDFSVLYWYYCCSPSWPPAQFLPTIAANSNSISHSSFSVHGWCQYHVQSGAGRGTNYQTDVSCWQQ